MKARVECPACRGSFKAPLAAEGRRAVCPKCEHRFVVSFTPDETPAVQDRPSEIVEVTSLQSRAGKSSRSERQTEEEIHSIRKGGGRFWTSIALSSIAALFIGYFCGREHLMYEMRNVSSQAAKVPPDESGEETVEEIKVADDGGDESEVTGVVDGYKEPEPEPNPRVPFGEVYSEDLFSITVAGATIKKPVVKDLSGETHAGKDELLVLHLRISNTAYRTVLEFVRYSRPVIFKLRDAKNNSIRGVSYGGSSRLVDGLRSGEGIAPRASRRHVEVFELPTPQTEFLVLTVNLKCLKSEGEIDFEIPFESINNRERIPQ